MYTNLYSYPQRQEPRFPKLTLAIQFRYLVTNSLQASWHGSHVAFITLVYKFMVCNHIYNGSTNHLVDLSYSVNHLVDLSR
jgi:hypothetical protein